MTDDDNRFVTGCLILLLVVLLAGWFAGCYVWIKSVQPIQIQVPRD
jgi:hypothetical protein